MFVESVRSVHIDVRTMHTPPDGIDHTCNHTLDDANVPVQHTDDTAAAIDDQEDVDELGLSEAVRVTHLTTRPVNVFEIPKNNIDMHRPPTPMSSTGLRPMRSEMRAHCMMNMASVAKNRDSC